jgi:hypothetical protein
MVKNTLDAAAERAEYECRLNFKQSFEHQFGDKIEIKLMFYWLKERIPGVLFEIEDGDIRAEW